MLMDKMTYLFGRLVFPGIIFSSLYCGQNSRVNCEESGNSSQCIAKTEDEQSVTLLNDDKTDEAIELLEKLRQEDSTKYYRHTRLAAAYASKAKLDFIQIAEAVQSGDSGGASALAEDLTEANKEAIYDKVFYIHKAIEVLESIPPEHRKKGSEIPKEEKDKKFYSASAFTQLFIYIAIHTQICEKTLTFVSVNLAEKDVLTGDGKAKSCGPIDILGNLGTVLSQVEGCDICGKVSEKIEEIQSQFSDVIGSETDIDEATSKLLDKFCQDQQAQNPDLACAQSLPEG